MAIALKAGIDAVRIPTLVSITLQYMGPDMVQVWSLEKSIFGIYVILMIDDMHVLRTSVGATKKDFEKQLTTSPILA